MSLLSLKFSTCASFIVIRNWKENLCLLEHGLKISFLHIFLFYEEKMCMKKKKVKNGEIFKAIINYMREKDEGEWKT